MKKKSAEGDLFLKNQDKQTGSFKVFISILRGINVSGQKKILMADLKALYEKLGFKNVSTYIQSGNVIFESNEKLPDTELAKKIETTIDRKYGFEVVVIIRSEEEMKGTISSNPFLKEKNSDTKRLYVTFLSEIPAKENVESIGNVDFSPDRFIIFEKVVYIYVDNGYGETRISNNFFEKKLKVKATTRNWNTVNKLSDLASSK
ncbi:MAG: DUF1697 domain-containing protein [Ginsengibacter sp.]